MDTFLAAVAAAVAGAAAGFLLTRWSQRQRDTRDDGRALQAKIHELELRIVRLEAKDHAVNLLGTRFAQQGGEDTDA